MNHPSTKESDHMHNLHAASQSKVPELQADAPEYTIPRYEKKLFSMCTDEVRAFCHQSASMIGTLIVHLFVYIYRYPIITQVHHTFILPTHSSRLSLLSCHHAVPSYYLALRLMYVCNRLLSTSWNKGMMFMCWWMVFHHKEH